MNCFSLASSRWSRALGLVLGCATLVSLIGCNNTIRNGTDPQALESFPIEKGKTTKQELVDKFGPPASTMSKADGTQTLTWTGLTEQVHNAGTIALAAFAPYAVHVKQDVHSTSLQVTIKDEIVIDFMLSSGDQHFENYR